ncbi:hypothetical protein AMATHDRAFT_67557 [Amanita thiersii Skay4041]|uniref:Sm domain-containing protein n=1 Tax=Amanita thiersii Skay4041 TaxID=703135 RepID=A0A2A9NIL4_9AGAR|nr:hypothetical protein AMATHDRAFT_67557 [Amanita thiersii Skay4041]
MADRGRNTGPIRGGAFRGGAAPILSQPGARRPFAPSQQPQLPSGDKPRREAILDLTKYVNEKIRVKFTGGREVTGILKGYDQLLNLVLDEVEELILEPEPHTRNLGLVVLRGPTITILSPLDGFEEIANPFQAQE